MKGRHLLQAGIAGLVLFALAVASQFVAVTYGAGGAEPPRVAPQELPADLRDRLAVVDGMAVARFSGTPYEMGHQHGAIFREQIHFLYREYFEKLAIPAVGRAELERWAKAVEPFVPPALKDEMRGLADGCGGTYDKILLVNAMIDRLQSIMCSTVVVNAEASKDGEIYFGRNLDFPGRNFLHRATVVLVFEPKGGTPVAAITWPGLVGALSGMNARGVAGATMMIHRGKEIRPGMPYAMMYREALSRARKTSDVFDYISKAKRTCPNNFMVVDSTGAAEVVEWDQDTVARRTPEQGGLCSTNHFRTEQLQGVGWPVGMKRYRSLDRFLEREHGRIDLPKIRSALREVASPWFMNVQAMIFLPARRSIHIAVASKLPAAASKDWAHLTRETLFGGAAER